MGMMMNRPFGWLEVPVGYGASGQPHASAQKTHQIYSMGLGSSNHAPLLHFCDKGLFDLQGRCCAYELGDGQQKRSSTFGQGSPELD